MTVAVAVAAVAPAGPEEKLGSYVDADEVSHHRETIAAVVAAAAACHHRETSVAAAAAAATACHRREIPYRRLYRRCFVGLRTSYTTMTCFMLLELVALLCNRLLKLRLHRCHLGILILHNI